MFNLREGRARRAEKRAAKIAAMADPTTKRAAKESERVAERGRTIKDPGPWTGGVGL